MKFLIIGIGNVGLRHIQGLINLQTKNLEFYLFDHNDDYKKKYEKEIDVIKENYLLRHVDKIEELANIEFEMTIISTTATNRPELLSRIVKEINTKFILVEKPICQSISELEDLKEFSSNKIFVNFPRRYCEWHKKIKKKLKLMNLNKIRKIKISGGYIGIACNTCHFIDLINSWTNKLPVSINTDGLGEWYISKRKGFYEVEGSLKIQFENNILLELNSYHYKEDLRIDLYDDDKLILEINYNHGYAKFSDNEIIKGRLKYQSENTHNLLKILQSNHKEICSLDNAINSYHILLKELVKNWNIKFKSNTKKIMIT